MRYLRQCMPTARVSDSKEDISFLGGERPLQYEACTASVGERLLTVRYLDYRECLLVALAATCVILERGTRDISTLSGVHSTRAHSYSYGLSCSHALKMTVGPSREDPRSVMASSHRFLASPLSTLQQYLLVGARGHYVCASRLYVKSPFIFATQCSLNYLRQFIVTPPKCFPWYSHCSQRILLRSIRYILRMVNYTIPSLPQRAPRRSYVRAPAYLACPIPTSAPCMVVRAACGIRAAYLLGHYAASCYGRAGAGRGLKSTAGLVWFGAFYLAW